MPPASHPIHAQPHECVNVERCKSEFAQAVAQARLDSAQGVADIGVQVARVRETVAVLASQTEDLRIAISAIPRDVAELLDRERNERADRMKRGEGHFDRLFDRLDKVEKRVIVLFVLASVLSLERVATMILPLVGSLLP